MVDKKLLMVCLTPLVLGLNAESFSAEVSESNQQIQPQGQAQNPTGQNAFAAAFGDDDDDEDLQPMPEQAVPQVQSQQEQAPQQPEEQPTLIENRAENVAEIPQPPMEVQNQILPEQQPPVMGSNVPEPPAQMEIPADVPHQEQQPTVQPAVVEANNLIPQEQQSVVEGNNLLTQGQQPMVEGVNLPPQGQPIMPEPQSANIPVVPGTQPETGAVPPQQVSTQPEEKGMLEQLFVNKDISADTPAEVRTTQPATTAVPLPSVEQPQVAPTVTTVEQPAAVVPQTPVIPVVPNVEPAVTTPQPQVLTTPVVSETATVPQAATAPVITEQAVMPQVPAVTPLPNVEQPQVAPTVTTVEQPAAVVPQTPVIPVVPNVESAVTTPQPQVLTTPVVSEAATVPQAATAPVITEQAVVPQIPAVTPLQNVGQPQVAQTITTVEQPATVVPQNPAIPVVPNVEPAVTTPQPQVVTTPVAVDPAIVPQTVATQITPSTIQAETEKAAEIISTQAERKLEQSAAINEEVKEGVSAVKEDVGDINEKIDGMLSVLEEQKKQTDELKENIDILTNIVAEQREEKLVASGKSTDVADTDNMREVSRGEVREISQDQDETLAAEEVTQNKNEAADGEITHEKLADEPELRDRKVELEGGVRPIGEAADEAEITKAEYESTENAKSIDGETTLTTEAMPETARALSVEELSTSGDELGEPTRRGGKTVDGKLVSEDISAKKELRKRGEKHLTQEAMEERKKAKEEKARLAAENREMVGQILKELQIIKEEQQENTKDLKNIKERIASSNSVLETVALHQEQAAAAHSNSQKEMVPEQSVVEQREVVSPKGEEVIVRRTDAEIVQEKQVDSPRQERIVSENTERASEQGQEQQSISPSPAGSSQDKVVAKEVQATEKSTDEYAEGKTKKVSEIEGIRDVSTKPAAAETVQEPVVTHNVDETPTHEQNSTSHGSNEPSRDKVSVGETQVTGKTVDEHTEVESKKLSEPMKTEDVAAKPRADEVAKGPQVNASKLGTAVSQDVDESSAQTEDTAPSGADTSEPSLEKRAVKPQVEEEKVDAPIVPEASKSQENSKVTETGDTGEAKLSDSVSGTSEGTTVTPDKDVKTVGKESTEEKSTSDAEPQKEETSVDETTANKVIAGDKLENVQGKSSVSNEVKETEKIDAAKPSADEENQQEKNDEKSALEQNNEDNTSAITIDEKTEKTFEQSNDTQKEKAVQERTVEQQENVSEEGTKGTVNEIVPQKEGQKTTNNSESALNGVEQAVKTENIVDTSKQLVNSLEELAQIKAAISEAMKAAK
ncbi:MAG: hypothetical protein IJ599_04115 [Alphaproteobacteria bacterium]|nr:hypothetical protein [Alphaproteobacteria bacterium]